MSLSVKKVRTQYTLTLGYKCRIFMPDDQAMEKTNLLQLFGAQVGIRNRGLESDKKK